MEAQHTPSTHLPKGKVDERMASSADIAPTILQYLGFEREPAMEGRSLLDSPAPERDAVFSQYGNLRYSLRTRDWKLIETRRRRIELYDLRRDPGEQANVADEQPERVSAMRSRLLEWIRTRPVLATEDEDKIELTQE